jgi:hypothetical protein
LKTLQSRSINHKAVQALQSRIIWFFDEFLAADNYQKDRAGKIVADLVVRSIQNRIGEADADLDLVTEYQRKTGNPPETITTHD